jgi:hypothetical protein
MTRNLIRKINILQSGYILNRSQTSHRINTPSRRSEEVSKNPIIPRESVHEPTRDHTPSFDPLSNGCGEGGTQKEDILYDPKRLLSRELDQGIKNGPGS